MDHGQLLDDGPGTKNGKATRRTGAAARARRAWREAPQARARQRGGARPDAERQQPGPPSRPASPAQATAHRRRRPARPTPGHGPAGDRKRAQRGGVVAAPRPPPFLRARRQAAALECRRQQRGSTGAHQRAEQRDADQHAAPGAAHSSWPRPCHRALRRRTEAIGRGAGGRHRQRCRRRAPRTAGRAPRSGGVGRQQLIMASIAVPIRP